MENERAQWGSKLGFILAAAGSAVGLGNIWKFPGKAYAGGGGAYILIYLAIILLIGVPVMLTELSLGRKTHKNTIGIFRELNKKYTWVGWAGIVCCAIIICYYGHVGGWVLRYIAAYVTEPAAAMDGGMNYFYNLLGYNAAEGTTFFPATALIFAAVFMCINCFIVVKGVSGGIEKFNKVGMPALFVILIVLLVRACTLDGAAEGIKYMLSFDFSKVDSSTFISALGQAFFSLSLGMAVMTTYGSYLDDDTNISKSSFIICGLDTLVAVLAGFVIVPAVFATLGAEGVGKGGGFAFGALGGVFNAMPAGGVFGLLFYLLLLFAALSSSISLAESVSAFICEEFHTDKKKTVIWLHVICYVIGIIYTLSQASYNIKFPWIDGTGINWPIAGDWMEFATDRLLLPICAFGECLFVGWIWKTKNVEEEVMKKGVSFKWAKLYGVLVKYLCPVAIAIILIVSMATGTTVS